MLGGGKWLLKKEAIEIDDEDKGEHWLLKEQTIKINEQRQ